MHFTEADLLETYYTAPGESLPVMMHLADCESCAATYDKLQKKMGFARECAHACRADRTSVLVKAAAGIALAIAVLGTVAALIVAP